MPWRFNPQTGALDRPDGSTFAIIANDLNQHLVMTLGTLQVDGTSEPSPIDEITVNEPTGTITWPRTGQSWVIVTDETASAVASLRATFVQELIDNAGWTQARARWFVGFLWRFIRAALTAARLR